MKKVYIKVEPTRDILIKGIFMVLLFLVSSPFFTLFKSVRLDLLKTISLYSTFAQISGLIIIVLSLLLLMHLKRSSFKQLLPVFFIIAYLLLSLISCFLAENTSNALWGTYRGEGFYVYVCYIAIGMGGFLVARHDKKLIGKLLKYLVFVAAFFAAVAILDNFFIDFYDTPEYVFAENVLGLPRSAFINSNYLGYYTAVTLMLSVHFLLYAKGKWQKIIFSFTSILISIASTISRSRGAILALIVGYILYFLYHILIVKDKKIIIMLIAFALARVGLDYIFNMLADGLYSSSLVENTGGLMQEINTGDSEGKNSFVIRFKMYLAAIELTKQRPVFGWGIDNIRDQLFALSGEFKDRCHNEILQKFATVGIPATLSYLTAIAMIFIRFLKNIRKQTPLFAGVFFAALIYFGSAQFGVSTPAVAPLFFMLMGVVYGATFETKEE